jgi:hypothetical protein
LPLTGAVDRDDQPFVPKLSHRTPYGHPGNAVLLGQFWLARQPRIRSEPPAALVITSRANAAAPGDTDDGRHRPI